jgi:anti-sigma factor RsiW
MSRTDKDMEGPAAFEAGRGLWRRCRMVEMPEDEAARFLDLAAFADGLLDDEERDRVASLLAGDPAAAADVAAARALSASGAASVRLEHIIARADALVDEAPASRRVLPFVPRSRQHMLQVVAQWGSLAAAIVVASWLGFAMGSGVSLTLSQPDQTSRIGEASFLPELLDPTTGFLGEGQQT